MMDNKPVQRMLGALIFLGCAIYIYAVVRACVNSFPGSSTPNTIQPFLSTVITSIAALFATNLGAVLGITITSTTSRFNKAEAWNPLKTVTKPDGPGFQIIACYVYILSLMTCTAVWALRDFTDDPTAIVPVIPEMTKSLLGVIIGSLAMALNIKSNGQG